MHEIAPLIKDLAIILGIAGVVAILFQKIRQPVVLGYLIAGIIIGPHTPPHALVDDMPNIKILSELGIIFLMFSLGLEFSFHKLIRVGFSATITGLIEVIFMIVLGFGAGQLIGWTFNDSLFLGAALAISSTTIIIKALTELNLKNKRFAEIIFGILVVEDLLAILLLVGLSIIVTTKNILSFDMLLAGIKLILVVSGWFVIGYFFVPTAFRRVTKYINEETLIIVSVGLCLLLVWMATYFHYSAALGAFIMGSILAETSLVHLIEKLIKPIQNLFAAVFFVSIGMLIDPGVIFEYFPIVVLLSFITIFGKLFTTTAGAFLSGQSINTSIRVGFGMSQIGEFSFIIVGLGSALNVISNTLYPVIVAVSAITTFTTPYLIKFSGSVSQRIENNLSDRIKSILDSYSSWIYRILIDKKHYHSYTTDLVRLIVNAIIIAIIFTIASHWLIHGIEQWIDKIWLSKLLTWVLALIISLPFIWGMLFSFKINYLTTKSGRKILNPAYFLIFFITFAELMILSVSYFHSWLINLLFISIAICSSLLFYRILEKPYQWFEKRLVDNLQQQKSYDRYYEQLAPWDTHLVEIEVGVNSDFLGKTLNQNQIRQNYGINIVAIFRNAKAILSPRGDQFILPYDKLIVLGNDDQIEKLRANFNEAVPTPADENILDDFELRGVLLEEGSQFIGKNLRDSKIRENVDGIIVGVERKNTRILNPDPSIVLEKDDILFIVGQRNKLKATFAI